MSTQYESPIDPTGGAWAQQTSGMGRPSAPYIEPLGRRVLTEGRLNGRSLLSPDDKVWTADAAAELVSFMGSQSVDARVNGRS